MNRNTEKYLNTYYSDIINELDDKTIKEIKKTLHYSICMLVYIISDFRNEVIDEIKRLILKIRREVKR